MITESPTFGRATGNSFDGSDTQAVGRPVKKVDGLEKVTGSAQFIADMVLPGMLYAKVLRSPIPHGRIVRIDTSKAKALRGVKAVITGQDVPDNKWGMIIKDHTGIAIDKVRYVGEEVAAVAAVTAEIAEAALDLIEVEYEELPPLLTMDAAFRNADVLVHENRPGNIAASISLERGNVEEGFAQADVIVEETFDMGYQFHAYIEPIGTIACFDRTGKLLMYSNTQSVWDTRHHLAASLGMPEADIRVIQTVVGGAFGGKTTDDNNFLIAAYLSRATLRPVRFLNTREDEFLASRPRMPGRITVKMGFKQDGTITAKQSFLIMDNGPFSARSPAVLGVAALRPDSVYRQTNMKVDAFLVYTNNIPTGSMRGFGGPQMTFAQEQVLDMAAEKLGMDPKDLRIRNATQAGDVTIHGSRIGNCGLISSLEEAARLLDWDEKRKNRVPYRGVGMGALIHVAGKRHFGDWDGSNAIITVNDQGEVLIQSGEGDLGQGSNTGMCQIVAEALGVPVEAVKISAADTNTTPYSHGVHASRMIYVGGNAVRIAAEKARVQLLETAAEMLEANADDLEVKDGWVSVVGTPEKKVYFTEVAAKRLYRRNGTPIVGVGTFDPDSEMVDAQRYGNESGAYSFGAQSCEVEVDPETGVVKVLKYICVNDVGKIINPVLAEGQVEGALAQGLGYALVEDMPFEDGRAVGMNMHDYKIPALADMPPMAMAFVADAEASGPFGAKGLGEPGMVPTAAVIANAVADAIGERVTSLPITPPKVLEALARKKARETSA